MKFLDQAKIYIRSGDGGSGCVAFRLEKFIEFGGPNGGDGGRGGDVIVTAVNGLNTLIDYRYQQHFTAQNGRGGMGKDRHGANGSDIVMKVPAGTQIYEEDGEIICPILSGPKLKAEDLDGIRKSVCEYLISAGYVDDADGVAIRVLRPRDLRLV